MDEQKSQWAMLSVSGSLSGVQSSLQSALDLVKFCLVVALPHPRFFGILILLSFTVILPIDIFLLLDIPKYRVFFYIGPPLKYQSMENLG